MLRAWDRGRGPRPSGKKPSRRLGQNQDFEDLSICMIFLRQIPKTES